MGKKAANQAEEASVVGFADAVVEPEAMVVEMRDTFVAFAAVFCLVGYVLGANLTPEYGLVDLDRTTGYLLKDLVQYQTLLIRYL